VSAGGVLAAGGLLFLTHPIHDRKGNTMTLITEQDVTESPTTPDAVRPVAPNQSPLLGREFARLVSEEQERIDRRKQEELERLRQIQSLD
jgi:hypothetical protein